MKTTKKPRTLTTNTCPRRDYHRAGVYCKTCATLIKGTPKFKKKHGKAS